LSEENPCDLCTLHGDLCKRACPKRLKYLVDSGNLKKYPRLTHKTPPATVACPDCGKTLRRTLTTQHIWVYECPDPKCEMIDLRFNPKLGIYNIHREARATGEVNEIDPALDFYTYPPLKCPGCGESVEMMRAGTIRKAAVYQCPNPKCHVSRFSKVDGGAVTHKTGQFYLHLRNKS
jgi:predicted RNA-binding Zn-ribbon protein involved in translation (DUF1610 family)